jgi:hypothetical protein
VGHSLEELLMSELSVAAPQLLLDVRLETDMTAYALMQSVIVWADRVGSASQATVHVSQQCKIVENEKLCIRYDLFSRCNDTWCPSELHHKLRGV